MIRINQFQECLWVACSNKWCRALRNADSDQNVIAARTCHCVTPTVKCGWSLIDVDQSPKHVSYNSCQHRQHVWCYESLEARQAAREVVWQATQEQWQEIVARTVPLIRCDLA